MKPLARYMLFLVLAVLIALTVFIGVRASQLATRGNVQLTPSTVATTNCNDWRIVDSPSLSSKEESSLNAVVAVSSQDVWAVGDLAHQVEIRHWDGHSWREVAASVARLPGTLKGLAALNASNIWAVGVHYDQNKYVYQTLIEHWDGTQWSVQTSPKVSDRYSSLDAIAVVAPDNAWAVGKYITSEDASNQITHALVEHWNGHTWSIVQGPASDTSNDALSGISALSASDIWAVGGSGNKALIEHWDGKMWSVVKGLDSADVSSSLSAVSAISAQNIWAVGNVLPQNANDEGLLAHWDGHKWSVIPISGPEAKMFWLSSLTALSANDIWAVGGYEDYNTRLTQMFSLHWDGAQWGLTIFPSNYAQHEGGNAHSLLAVAATDAYHVWAVGSRVVNESVPPIGDPGGTASALPLVMFHC